MNPPNSAPPKNARRAPWIAFALGALAIVLGFALFIHQRLSEDDEQNPAQALQGAPGAGAKAERCRACEAQKCSAVLAGCSSQQCQSVLSCVRKAQCADPKADTLVPCYCGSVVQDDCFFDKAEPKGPCRAEIEAGMGTKKALDIGQRYFDTQYEAGKAFQLMNCDMARCQECL